MRRLIALALLAAASTVAAAPATWSNIGAGYELQDGSGRLTTEGGKTVASATLRHTVGKNVYLSKAFVDVQDCARESGTLTLVNMNGSYIGESNFVFGGGNVASAVAKILCGGVK